MLICPLVEGEPAQAVAVYDGEVVAVMFNKGFENAVLVRHGDYYTLYSGLEKTGLTEGAKVAKNQMLGNISATGKNGFIFEIWKGTEKQNTASWLSCKL